MKTLKAISFIVLAVVLSVTFIFSSSAAAFDAFLKIESIPGESTAIGYEGWIEVSTFNIDVYQSSSSVAGGRAAAKAVFGDLVITKAVDTADPLLTIACAEGKHLGEAELVLCYADGRPYMSLKLEPVMVSSVAHHGVSGSDDAVPTVTVTLSYDKITWKYTKYDPATGMKEGDIRKTWNVEKNIQE